MRDPFLVVTTSHFDRMMQRLNRGHTDIADRFGHAFTILSEDPHNHTRKHPIIKLEGVGKNGGQYRLRLGRWRFRYDIDNHTVILKYCGLRREDTYR